MLAANETAEILGGQFTRWGLHTALAWRLSLNDDWAARAHAGQFRPGPLWADGHRAADCETHAWGDLHKLMASDIPCTTRDGHRVRIPVLGVLEGGDGTEVLIEPHIVETLDWNYSDEFDEVCLSTRRDAVYRASGLVTFRKVYVPASALKYNFSIGNSEPLLTAATRYPPARCPSECSYMPMVRAAHWIATKGNTFDFFISDEAVWLDASGALRAAICSGEVELIGRENGSPMPDKIPGFRISGIEILPPGAIKPYELIFCERPHLRLMDVGVTDADWAQGHTDEIWGRGPRKADYTHLEVRGADVSRLWPFAGAPLIISSARTVLTKTARPTDEQVRNVIDAENRERAARGDVRKVTTHEALKIVQLAGLNADRSQARRVASELKGNSKTGPQGPRK